jgi:hypothetical protein
LGRDRKLAVLEALLRKSAEKEDERFPYFPHFSTKFHTTKEAGNFEDKKCGDF